MQPCLGKSLVYITPLYRTTLEGLRKVWGQAVYCRISNLASNEDTVRGRTADFRGYTDLVPIL